MIEGLKPYEEYKMSEISWTPLIPKTWGTERAKWLFTKMNRPVRSEDDVITCFRDGMVTLRKNRRLRGFTEAIVEVGYQGIRRGDLVIHAMDAFAGAVGVSDSDGKGTPVYSVCQPKAAANAYYYAHTVREMSRAQWILALAKGIRERSTDFRFETFGNQLVPLPPPEDQASIVRFLDHANRKIDTFIHAKRKLIALLNEQKQAIIHNAVTRGLDPDVPLKPSGIPWLGDIPAHWSASRLKALVKDSVAGPYGSSLTKAMYVREGIRVYGQQQVIPDNFKLGDYYISAEKFAEMRRYQVYPDDILVSVMGTVGRVAVVPADAELGIINPRLVRYRPDLMRVRPRYLQLVMQAPTSKDQLLEAAKGTTMEGLNMGILARLQLVIPPLIEQDQILSFVKKETANLNTAIARTEREIALMQEYRTRLTADIVTGKLDVREAAARLPDLPPEAKTAPDIAIEDDTETEEM